MVFEKRKQNSSLARVLADCDCRQHNAFSDKCFCARLYSRLIGNPLFAKREDFSLKIDKSLHSCNILSKLKMEERFKITTGEDGYKRVTFYHVAKVNFAEMIEIKQREFPGIPDEKINIIPGYVFCTFTTAKE